MIDSQQLCLYLAVPLKEEVLASYCTLSPSKLKQLNEYLEVIDYEGDRYLGKKLGPELSVDSLVTAEAHILSLLHRFIPVQNMPRINVISIPS
jgi:hypothetical protein